MYLLLNVMFVDKNEDLELVCYYVFLMFTKNVLSLPGFVFYKIYNVIAGYGMLDVKEILIYVMKLVSE